MKIYMKSRKSVDDSIRWLVGIGCWQISMINLWIQPRCLFPSAGQWETLWRCETLHVVTDQRHLFMLHVLASCANSKSLIQSIFGIGRMMGSLTYARSEQSTCFCELLISLASEEYHSCWKDLGKSCNMWAVWTFPWVYNITPSP